MVKAGVCCEPLLSWVLMRFSCSWLILHPVDALGMAKGKKLDEDGQNRRYFPELGWLCSSQSVQKTSSARRKTSNTAAVWCSSWLKSTRAQAVSCTGLLVNSALLAHQSSPLSLGQTLSNTALPTHYIMIRSFFYGFFRQTFTPWLWQDHALGAAGACPPHLRGGCTRKC